MTNDEDKSPRKKHSSGIHARDSRREAHDKISRNPMDHISMKAIR